MLFSQGIFLEVCTYLHFYDTLALATTCRLYRDFFLDSSFLSELTKRLFGRSSTLEEYKHLSHYKNLPFSVIPRVKTCFEIMCQREIQRWYEGGPLEYYIPENQDILQDVIFKAYSPVGALIKVHLYASRDDPITDRIEYYLFERKSKEEDICAYFEDEVLDMFLRRCKRITFL